MGHRFSKYSSNSLSGLTTNKLSTTKKTDITNTNINTSALEATTATAIPTISENQKLTIPTPLTETSTINLLRIQQSPTVSNSEVNNTSCSSSSNLSTGNPTVARHLIIKIQYKMENGNKQLLQQTASTSPTTTALLNEQEFLDNCTDANLNQQILNVTLNGNACHDNVTNIAATNRTAGSSVIFAQATAAASTSPLATNSVSTSNINNNFRTSHTYNALPANINMLQIKDDLEESATESVEYCEVLEDNTNCTTISPTDATQQDETHVCETDLNNICCRHQIKPTSSSYVSKIRSCKNALKSILPTTKSNKNKDRKEVKHSKDISIESTPVQPYQLPQLTQHQNLQLQQQQQQQIQIPRPNSIISSSISTPISISTVTTDSNVPASNQLSIWANTNNDVIIPITSPQLVLLQCPRTSMVTLSPINNNAIHLLTTGIVNGTTNANSITNTTLADTSSSQLPTTVVKSAHNAPIVHSQVDFVHCLVPDLEKITNSSFYWGKMDRYEAERLLEGKPEGTFLLRDSAQEEFLFSVTFRKYGRSLHARIEQSGHKFSFDCHDPCVFTARTVTGLLEHYKDPTCVMFFEPMLTIPLHRKSTFSLQQLCRAAIVSHTTYDGINELELPARLKSYLKEYHYKQKLRMKQFDEPMYSCT